MATGSSGSGGANDTVKQTTYGTKSFVPNVPSFTGTTIYYGFYIAPGTGTLNFYRGDNGNSTNNPNAIYVDGTSNSTWASSTIYGEIRYASVPAAPGKPSVPTVGSNYVDLEFTQPSDNGGATIDGYRILVSTDQATWYSTDELAFGNSSGTISVVVEGYYATSTATTLTPLSPATNYYFKAAAINEVSRAHSTNFKDTSAHTGTNSATSDPITTLGYGKRFTSTTTTTDIRYASRYTGNSGDSVTVDGVTYTGWKKIDNIQRKTSGGWTNLTG